MKIKLHDETVLKVEEPSEKEQIEYLTMLEEYQRKAKEEGELIAQKYAIDLQDRLLSKLSMKTLEEVQKMALVDKSKCVEAIKSRFMVLGRAEQKMDF